MRARSGGGELGDVYRRQRHRSGHGGTESRGMYRCIECAAMKGLLKKSKLDEAGLREAGQSPRQRLSEVRRSPGSTPNSGGLVLVCCERVRVCVGVCACACCVMCYMRFSAHSM